MAEEDNKTAVKKEERTLAVALIAVVLVCATLVIVGFFFLEKPDEIIQGQADATSVRVSGKLPGRVTEFYVQEGDMVKAGDTLVHIHSSLVEAKLQQAEAMQNAAAAQDRKIDAGTRPQNHPRRGRTRGTGTRCTRNHQEDLRPHAGTFRPRCHLRTET